MSALTDKWRRRATELNEALPPLLSSTGVVPAVVQATKAAVLPEIYNVLADMVDAIKGATTAQEDTVASTVSRDNILRLAAVRGVLEGKWDDFDRIIDNLGLDSGAAKPNA